MKGLNILNATRVIIKRADRWRMDSRLYHIEIRWDYDCVYSTFLWNNERDALPMATRGNAVHIPREHVAQLCSKLGLMYKSRFEKDITVDVYLEVWRTDLRDNIEEQRKLTLTEALKGRVNVTVKPQVVNRNSKVIVTPKDTSRVVVRPKVEPSVVINPECSIKEEVVKVDVMEDIRIMEGAKETICIKAKTTKTSVKQSSGDDTEDVFFDAFDTVDDNYTDNDSDILFDAFSDYCSENEDTSFDVDYEEEGVLFDAF